jgi:RNA polymerase sigma factor (sigma-70 family)
VHVGHPLLDHLEGVARSRPIETSRAIALLAGSRASVIERNLPWMLDVARRAQAELGPVPWVVLHDDEGQRARLGELIARHGTGLDLRLSIGALHAELGRARAALSVSGTVLLDLLHQRLPSVVVYRLGSWREAAIGRRFVTAPWFSVTNLLAGRELLPEFGFAGEGPRAEVAAALVRAYADEAWRAQCLEGLDLAARRLGPPGAARRAAREALDVASTGRISPRTPEDDGRGRVWRGADGERGHAAHAGRERREPSGVRPAGRAPARPRVPRGARARRLRDDAMDLSQEAFLKVYKARDTFRAEEPFLPWFHRILRNTCFSHLRAQGRLRPRSVSAREPGADEDEGDYDIADEGDGRRPRSSWTSAPRPSGRLSARSRRATARSWPCATSRSSPTARSRARWACPRAR